MKYAYGIYRTPHRRKHHVCRYRSRIRHEPRNNTTSETTTMKPSRTYKIRKLTTNNVTGDAHGITIPQDIALKYQNVPLQIYPSGTGIILDTKLRF